MTVESRPSGIRRVNEAYYATPEPFVHAMNLMLPEKVFSFVTHQSIGGEFEEVTQDKSFDDRKGAVHHFHSVTEGADSAMRIAGVITRAMVDNNISVVEGAIKVDHRTGEKFFIYETSQPDKQEQVDLQMSAWKESVQGIRDAGKPGGFEYFGVSREIIVVDFVDGKDHHVTVLYGDTGNDDKGYELSDVYIDFKLPREGIKRNINHKLLDSKGSLPLSRRNLK